jgi:hypothetical protein
MKWGRTRRSSPFSVNYFDIPVPDGRFQRSKVGLRAAETAFQNVETPFQFYHI